jgi:hypothetical protein
MAPFIVIAIVCLTPPLSPLGALPHPGIVGCYAPRRKAERQFGKRIDADCAAAARIWEEREANCRKKEPAITTTATVGFISWTNGCDHRGEKATRGRARGACPRSSRGARRPPKRRLRCRRMAPRPSLFRDQCADPLGAVVEESRLPVRNLSPLRTKARPLGTLPSYMQPSVYTQLGLLGERRAGNEADPYDKGANECAHLSSP